jgi:hypothetical protein
MGCSYTELSVKDDDHMECQGMHLNEGLDISMGITCYWHLVVTVLWL